jgi:hexulose-6-phosphate isomerase
MYKCINSWTFEVETPIARMAELCAQTRIEGIELGLGAENGLNLDSDEEDCRTALKFFREKGIKVVALTSNLYWNHHFASPDSRSREMAARITTALLERAVWLEAPLVKIIPAVTGKQESGEFISYDAALQRCFEGLLNIVVEAEQRGVKLAIRPADERFLLSPVEMRELLDRLNSHAVGVALDIDDISRLGRPAEWIRILRYRVLSVSTQRTGGELIGGSTGADENRGCSLGETLAALREVNYAGPVIYQGAGDFSRTSDQLRHWRLAD